MSLCHCFINLSLGWPMVRENQGNSRSVKSQGILRKVRKLKILKIQGNLPLVRETLRSLDRYFVHTHDATQIGGPRIWFICIICEICSLGYLVNFKHMSCLYTHVFHLFDTPRVGSYCLCWDGLFLWTWKFLSSHWKVWEFWHLPPVATLCLVP